MNSFHWLRNAMLPVFLTATLGACGQVESGEKDGFTLAAAMSLTGPAVNRNTPIISPKDPTRVTDCLYGRHVVLGLSRLSGGYINFAHFKHGKVAKIPCSEIRKGHVANEVAAGQGRGWQPALRDFFHSGRYNPTQAGFVDGAGTVIPDLIETRRNVRGVGQVRGLTTAKFNMPLFSDPVYDFTHHEDLHPDTTTETSSGAKDRDGIGVAQKGGPDGANQDAEVRSEFDFIGSVEVWTDAVGVGDVDVFRQKYSMQYERKPKAIKQFGPKARLNEGGRVLDESFRRRRLSDERGGRPENTDMSSAVLVYGIRLNRSARFDTVLWLGKNGNLKRRPVTRTDFRAVDPGSKFGPDAKGGQEIGGRVDEVAYGSLMMLCRCGGKGKDRAWAIYAPNTDINERPVYGKRAKIVYTEDRRMRTMFKASREGEGGGTIPVHGGVIEAQLNALRVSVYFNGLYAPGRTGRKIREGIRQEVFLLHGSPEDIVKTAATIEKKLKIK